MWNMFQDSYKHTHNTNIPISRNWEMEWQLPVYICVRDQAFAEHHLRQREKEVRVAKRRKNPVYKRKGKDRNPYTRSRRQIK